VSFPLSVSQEKARSEFERRRAEAEVAADAKTAKNRAKRMKKKSRGRKGGDAEGGGTAERDGADDEDDSQKRAKKQKLGASGDAVVVFRSAEERGMELDDEDDGEEGGSGGLEENEPAQQNDATVETPVEESDHVRRAEERGISIVDDD
jgi:Protein of unknown function (DUF1168)